MVVMARVIPPVAAVARSVVGDCDSYTLSGNKGSIGGTPGSRKCSIGAVVDCTCTWLRCCGLIVCVYVCVYVCICVYMCVEKMLRKKLK